MRFVDIVWLVSGSVVVAFGLSLVGLAVVIATKPSLADRFLRSFASSSRAHYTEQGLRLLVGGALVNCAGSMWYPNLFRFFGWLIVVTTAGLLLIPWRWHRTLATWVMPAVFRQMTLFALAASALGAFILYAVLRGVSS